jgi:hypothetical protein
MTHETGKTEPPWDNTTDVIALDEVPAASSYGCGSESCQVCSPVIYRCQHGVDYPKPLMNNEAARTLSESDECTHHEPIEED